MPPERTLFGKERTVDLSGVYDDERRKREKVRGLIETLSRYKFTVEENTPLEEEIALDPELLGKVFENLLASYNEDTRTTARKALGGFYTPREIVSYMVDESLIAFLQTALVGSIQLQKSKRQDLETRLRSVFAADPASFANPFSPSDTATLIAAIGRVKILDPACGSGAFPMGALHRLVDVLQKLDPNNESWKRDRLAEAERYCDMLRQSDADRDEVDQCEARIEDTQLQQLLLERVVGYLLSLSEYLRMQTSFNVVRDSLMLGWWEQLLNGLIYELYFPAELHAASIHLFELIAASSLPELNTLPEPERLPRLRAEFERTYDPSHPLRGALFNLGSLEAVRVIEGRE